LPATAEEVRRIAEEEDDEGALLQAIETTRAGRKRKAAPKVVENMEQAKLSNRGGKQGGGKRGE
jgi:hypothetical protein